MQKRPTPGSSGASLAKRPHLESGNEAHPSGMKSTGGSVTTSSADARREAMGVGAPDVPPSSTSSSFLSAVFQVSMLFNFLDQWRRITGLCLIWFCGHHLLLRLPPLLHNFCQFNVKATAAHHSIIQKEVDDVLSNGVIEPFSGGAGYYSSMFVVPKCTGGLQP